MPSWVVLAIFGAVTSSQLVCAPSDGDLSNPVFVTTRGVEVSAHTTATMLHAFVPRAYVAHPSASLFSVW